MNVSGFYVTPPLIMASDEFAMEVGQLAANVEQVPRCGRQVACMDLLTQAFCSTIAAMASFSCPDP